ncbi:MAG: homoserine dehydrogenase [Promicromonosporaceae bacterium]|nr:homoserine dehydrogenase [Promicromonosporaceae bacterium]
MDVVVLGAGVVGTEVIRGILAESGHLSSRIGVPLELKAVVVSNLDKPRDPVIPQELLTTDAETAVDGADIVIELMGGIEPAKTLITRALDRGTSVVTANKALMASHGPGLYAAAEAAGVDLLYEAAVAGAIPIIRPIRDSLAGDHVNRILGIVNGTTNFVLDQMSTQGSSLDEAVAVAQEKGFAETDPSADIDGLDAAAKAAILASLAFHSRVAIDDVATEGIRGITAEDVAWATKNDQVIKLLAAAERTDDGVLVSVQPALIPAEHPLAAVRGAFNAVFVEAGAAGPLMFYGQGAGGKPTSSAVLGDLVTAARHRVLGGRALGESAYAALPVVPAGRALARYQIRMVVDDIPGVLAQVAGLLAARDISIETVIQTEYPTDNTAATLIITTHKALEAELRRTLVEIAALAPVREIVSVLRVERGTGG